VFSWSVALGRWDDVEPVCAPELEPCGVFLVVEQVGFGPDEAATWFRYRCSMRWSRSLLRRSWTSATGCRRRACRSRRSRRCACRRCRAFRRQAAVDHDPEVSPAWAPFCTRSQASPSSGVPKPMGPGSARAVADGTGWQWRAASITMAAWWISVSLTDTAQHAEEGHGAATFDRG